VEVNWLYDDLPPHRGMFFKYPLLIWKVVRMERAHGRVDRIKNQGLKRKLSEIIRALAVARNLERIIDKYKNIGTEITYYSYWFFNWALVLSLLKHQSKIKKFVSRTHFGDLYTKPNTKMVLTAYKLLQVDSLVAVSQHGVDYMHNRYPYFKEKIELSYLGVPYCGQGPLPLPDEIFTMVSCSSVVPRKRVDKIIDSISLLEFPVKWIHFGTGKDLEMCKERASEKIVGQKHFEFKGFQSNSAIVDFYRTNAVHLFITLSELEGLPVSLMEAASFGIPLLGTRVFGIPEVCEMNNGVLVEKDDEPEHIANQITQIWKMGINNRMRAASLDVYEKKFKDTRNYIEFYKLYLEV
jgi:glycosyltransferase involved in cell wall biosynthesis